MQPARASAWASAAIALLFSVVASGGRLGGLHSDDWLTPAGYMRIADLERAIQLQGALQAAGSNMVDFVLMTLSAPLATVFGWSFALGWMAALFGPLCMAAYGGALGWAMTPLIKRHWHAAVTLGACLPVAALGLPGKVDGHAMLPAAALVLAGTAWRRRGLLSAAARDFGGRARRPAGANIS